MKARACALFAHFGMCGRAALTLAPDVLQKRLDVIQKWINLGLYKPSFNITPGTTTPVLLHDGKGQRTLHCMEWGIPNPFSGRTINARSETLAEKRSFAPLLKTGRCVVVADGYYEWAKKGGKRQAYFFRFPRNQVLTMAGLYQVKLNKKSGQIEWTYAVITVPAHASFAAVHERMPAVLDPQLIDVWLGPDLELALALLVPNGDLEWFPVGAHVGILTNDSPLCIEPLDTVKLEPGDDTKAWQSWKGFPPSTIEQYFTPQVRSAKPEAAAIKAEHKPSPIKCETSPTKKNKRVTFRADDALRIKPEITKSTKNSTTPRPRSSQHIALHCAAATQ